MICLGRKNNKQACQLDVYGGGYGCISAVAEIAFPPARLGHIMNRQPEIFLSHTTRVIHDYNLAHYLATGL
jgi:hypothetical protein